MSVIFKEEGHKYESLDPTETTKWISATSIISRFKEKFDAPAVAAKSSKNKRSKWYGIPPETILQIWETKANNSMSTGTWYHNQREQDVISLDSIERNGVTLPIIKPIIEGGIKKASIQRLTEGIYPEHFVFLKSAGWCGQLDRLEILGGVVDIIDYKTNEEIKTKSFINWEGISKKMLHPLSHLDDCNYNHYALQLSIYMYIVLKHNPIYKPGKLILHHIIFEKDGKDEFDTPILKKDANGDPIVQEVVPYEMPYLKSEVIAIINYLKENPEA